MYRPQLAKSLIHDLSIYNDYTDGIDAKEFLNELTRMFKMINSDSTIFCDGRFISDTLKISNKILRKTRLLQSIKERISVCEKLIKIVREIAINNWILGCHYSIKKVFNKKPLKRWKNLILMNIDLLDKKGKAFVCKNVLHPKISKQENRIEKISDRILLALSENKKISSIQIQGCLPLYLEQTEECLRNPGLLDAYVTPPTCKWLSDEEGKTIEFIVHPQLLLKASFFQGWAAQKEHMDHKFNNSIDFSSSPITPETFILINRFIIDQKSITIDENNIEEIICAANFLGFSILMKYCDALLASKVTIMDKDQVIHWISFSEKFNLTQCNQKLQARLNYFLKKNRDSVDLLEALTKLNENGISSNSLILNSLFYLKDEDLEIIITLHPNLKFLNVNYCKNLTDQILPHIAKLTQLQQLCLAGCSNLSNAIGPHIAKLSQLKHINLPYCELITDALLPYLTTLSQLQHLNLAGCKLSDAISPYLLNFSQLQVLNLAGCSELSDAMGPYLTNLLQLQQLNLSGCAVSNDIGPYIANLAQLQLLNLSHCELLSDGIGPYIAMLSRLQHLDLSHDAGVMNAIGPHIANLFRLQELDLSYCAIRFSYDQPKQLALLMPYLKLLPDLKRVTLGDYGSITTFDFQ